MGVLGDDRLPAALRGPRLQVFNLAAFYAVVIATIDYGNPLDRVAGSILLAAVLDVVWNRARTGAWETPPFGPVIATLGAWLVLDGHGWLAYLAVPVVIVASRHVLRWRGGHVFNANNLAMAALIVLGAARIGVNDWGASPQTVALMVLFGTIATLRVRRLDLALMYLAFSFAVHGLVAASMDYGMETVWLWALSPLQVMLGFFAVTDPATSPGGDRLEKAVFALAVVLLSVPATIAGRVEAPVFALLVVAPQRHLIARGVQALRARGAVTARPEGTL